MGDTGLLITQVLRTSNIVQEDLYRKIITGHLGANLGMIFENMVAQMLRARGYELFFHEYYYTPKGKKTEQKYEVDFLIVKDGHLCLGREFGLQLESDNLRHLNPVHN